jgi:hypothetical protein
LTYLRQERLIKKASNLFEYLAWFVFFILICKPYKSSDEHQTIN